MTIILKPFAWLLLLFNNLTGYYGVALILFTLVVKVILFPFALKGKKSMIKTTMLQGEMQKLQKQYANNKQKYNEEVQKLYEREKVNPMGGCLWSLIPLILLIPLYAIIRQPMQYLMSLTAEQVAAVAEVLGHTMGKGGYEELFLAAQINGTNLAAVQAVAPGAFAINFNFLGINLAQVPTWKFWEGGVSWGSVGLFLLPLVSVALSYLMIFVTNKTNAMNNPDAAKMAGSSRVMMLVMPLMYLWFGFIMPGGMSVYILASSGFSIIQEIICGFMLKKDYEAAAAEKARRAELEKEEEKRKKAALAEERARRAEEKKQNKGKKKEKPAGSSGVDVSASRVGIRAYARGRAYDPDRFGGVTEYKDPGKPVDEDAIEAVLEKRAAAREEAEMEAEVEAAVEARLAAEKAGMPIPETAGETEEAEPETEEVPEETQEAEEAAEEAETPEETAEAAEETAEEAPEEPEEAAQAPEGLTEAPKYDAPDYHGDKEDE